MKKENIAIFFAMIMTAVALTGCRMTDRTTISATRDNVNTNQRYTASQLMNYSLPNAVNPATNQFTSNDVPALTAQNNTINSITWHSYRRNPITVDHISSALGLTETEFNVLFPRYGHGSGSKAYNIYGKDTGIDVGFDENNRINKVTVVTDKFTAARWQRELNARYGIQTINGEPANNWTKEKLQVYLNNSGPDVRIIFTSSL